MKKTFLRLCTAMCLVGGVAMTTGLLTSCDSNPTSTVAETKDLTVTGTSELVIGGSTTLSVKCDGKNVSETITYTSSNEAVATVNASGKVTAVAEGTATITASAEGYNAGTITITVISNTQDVTVKIKPIFAEESSVKSVQEGYTIFFGAPLGDGGAWTFTPATYNMTDETYDIVLEDIEYDQTLQYNTYYSRVESEGWDYRNTENVSNEPHRLLTIEKDVTEVEIDSTFNIPATLAELTLKVKLTIGGVAGAELNEGISLYVTGNFNDWSKTSAAEWSADDEAFIYTATNVAIGTSDFALLLGTPAGCEASWSNSDYVFNVRSTAITAGMTELEIDATFGSQPEYDSSAATYAYTINLNCTDAVGTAQVVIDGVWQPMSWVSDGVYKLEIAALTAGTHSFYFYNWISAEDVKTIYDGTVNTLFTIDVQAAGSISVTGSFVSGIGSVDA